jgi:hypothetical protein
MVKAIEHDTNKRITDIPQEIHYSVQELKRELSDKLPYFDVKARNSLMHSIDFRASLQPKDTWKYGYFLNAQDIVLGTICAINAQWIEDVSKHNYEVDFITRNGGFKHVRARKNLSLYQALQYVVKQLTK